MVKRIIRRNNYNQYEKTHAQCIELGLLVNRPALDRFADKLQLIDRAELSRRQNDVNKLKRTQRQVTRHKRQPMTATRHEEDLHAQLIQPNTSVRPAGSDRLQTDNPLLAPTHNATTSPSRRPNSRHRREMTYEEVKKREAEITFELGEIKIRESELLQELITLSEMLEEKQFN